MSDHGPPLRVTVLGLGEAGTSVAEDLVARGVEVHAFDPASRPTPSGVVRHDEPAATAVDVDAVLALTAAVDAETALRQVLELLPAGALYVDLATSSAERKQVLAELAAARGVDLVDVALMATVPGRGLSTPQLAAGRGATRYQALLQGLGVEAVTVVGQVAGDAATRKLLRSVLVKGLTAVVIEALRAGEAAGLGPWTYEHVVAELGAFDEPLVRRLVEGTGPHARRRRHEVEAAAELLASLGIEAPMTAATAASLDRVAELGVPALPPRRDMP